MEAHSFFFMLCCAAALLLAGAQTGFISIDCGLIDAASYVDPYNHLTYVSDEGFIEGGVNVRIKPGSLGANASMGYYTVRSFPNYTRNCYQLPATAGTKYIVRAAFLYGNYDDLDQVPSFHLYLGADLWDTVKLDDNDTPFRTELVVQAEARFLYVCLVNTGQGTPFISSLKLRPLPQNMYAPANSSFSRVLKTFKRVDVGASTYTSYPDDRFDRIWEPNYDGYGTPYSTSEPVVESTKLIFGLPSVVMQTAVYSSDQILVNWTGGVDNLFYLYLEFADVRPSPGSQSREMNVLKNGENWGDASVFYLDSNVLYSTAPLVGASQYSFSIRPANASDELGAVLNSFEVYEALTFNGSATDAENVMAIMDVKEYYQLKKNWMGDPCLPSPWDGLTCDDAAKPRIKQLDLSNGELSGMISGHLSNLTDLKTLNLSTNNLQGSVPSFLQDMPNLVNIDLSGNNLSGSIPSDLKEKVKNGVVMLKIDNNPLLCQQDQCNQQEDINSNNSITTGSKGSNSAIGLKNSVTVFAISAAAYLLSANGLLF